MVLDALDEAASDRDRRQIIEALAELAVLPGLRVAVATRPLAAGNPYAPDRPLPALGVTTRDDPNLVDLDSDTYFDVDGLRQFAGVLLAQEGLDHPGPPGAAGRSIAPGTRCGTGWPPRSRSGPGGTSWSARWPLFRCPPPADH